MNRTINKLIALVLCFVTVFGCVTVFSEPALAAEDGITLRINQLKTQFPHGKFWNHYVTKASEAGLSSSKNEAFANSVTSHCCASHSANAKVGQYECNYFDGGIQCWGFAVKVFYDIFGVRASKMSKRYDTENIKVGDYLRFGSDSDGHSAVVIARSGNTLTLVEGNYRPTGSAKEYCHINWGRTVKVSQVSYYKRASNYDTVKNDVSYTLDVNVSLDSKAYNNGHDNVTYDVYVNNKLVADDVKDHCAKYAYGSSYTVNDIKVSGCFKLSDNNAITGKVTANTAATVKISVNHTPEPVPETPAQCLKEGLSAGEKCSVCDTVLIAQTPTPPKGHDYKNTVIPATCKELQLLNHDCKDCSHEYTETDPSLFTEWSEKKPPENAIEVQTKTEYRYAEKEESWEIAETGTIDYALSWHSGFDKNNSLYTKYNKTPVTASESEDTKIEVTTADIGYIYWHWCRGDYTDGPINRKVSNGKTSDYDTFHAFVSTQNAATVADSGARKIENKSVCKDTYWWIIDRIQLKRCTYTKYVRVNTDGWSNWSQWQAEEITGSDTVKVETRTLYRWIAPSDKLYSEHTWGEWQYKPFSVKAVRVCTVCEEKDNKVIALLGDADFNGIVNATDARIALRISVELEKYTEKHLETADIEKDGKITAADARLILRASVGLEELVRE